MSLVQIALNKMLLWTKEKSLLRSTEIKTVLNHSSLNGSIQCCSMCSNPYTEDNHTLLTSFISDVTASQQTSKYTAAFTQAFSQHSHGVELLCNEPERSSQAVC